MKELIVMPMSVKKNMYILRLDDLITARELEVALTRFKTVKGVIEFIVDFCDYSYIFGQDNLLARDVDMERDPKVFDAIANACRRLRKIIGLSDTLQIDNYKVHRNTVWIIVKYEVPTNERTGDV